MQMDSSIESSPKASVRLVALNFRVPLQMRRQLRMLAAARDVTMSALILEALDQIVTSDSDSGTVGFESGSGFGT